MSSNFPLHPSVGTEQGERRHPHCIPQLAHWAVGLAPVLLFFSQAGVPGTVAGGGAGCKLGEPSPPVATPWGMFCDRWEIQKTQVQFAAFKWRLKVRTSIPYYAGEAPVS